jgi:hypothetical protein
MNKEKADKKVRMAQSESKVKQGRRNNGQQRQQNDKKNKATKVAIKNAVRQKHAILLDTEISCNEAGSGLGDSSGDNNLQGCKTFASWAIGSDRPPSGLKPPSAVIPPAMTRPLARILTPRPFP